MLRADHRRLIYQLDSVEDAECLHALLSGWHEYLTDMKFSRSVEQSAARVRHLHGKHVHVEEKALLHRNCDDCISPHALHTVMHYWIHEVDRAF